MALFLNNVDVKGLLTMEMTMEALEKAYVQMIRGEAVCRPRIDLQIPTSDPQKIYQWGTMEGGSSSGYFAIRMKSDVLYEQEYGGTRTLEKYCVQPGTFCGLIFLFRVDNGEPLALINDGYLQHMRVGADSGLGVKYMAREDSKVVGMFGSGGMARSHVDAIRLVRNVKRIQVYSPTQANRVAYAQEMEEKHGIETIPLDRPEDVYKRADILAGCTDASVPVILGKHVQKGTHIISVGGRPDQETFKKIDRFLRLGNATSALGKSEVTDEFLIYAIPELEGRRILRPHKHSAGVVKEIGEDKVIYLKDILGGKKGRRSADEITYSERGNLQGAQFHAVAGRVYELARERGVGRKIPTEWFLQDIRD
ncbi:MAG: ornithine cyclodeaminase family protein [Thermodesulfobacteriota bacterium]|nr:ornithine cyclodeaminase family protein [Thermodesulfobacteriota bacterium]